VIGRLDADGASVKLPAEETTVSAMVVVAVVLPEVPLMVTVAAPVVAVLLAVSVSTLVPVVGLVPNAAVTPLGRPEAASVTLPVNPPVSATVMVSVAVLAWVMDKLDAEGVSVKPAVVEAVTERLKVVVAVVVPEVPVMVTVDAPVVAVALAVRVSTLLPVVGLVPKAAVTPLGRPDAASVTLPVKVPTSVTVIVSVPLLPWAIESEVAEGLSVKPFELPGIVITRVAELTSEPSVPVSRTL